MPGPLENFTEEDRELALLARDLSKGNETRKEFLSLVRKVRPETPMPELDIDDRLARSEKDFQDRIAAMEAKQSEKEMRAELDRRRQKLLDSGKASSPEDIEAIEKLMLEKGIQSHDTAAEYFDWMKQAARPTPPAYEHNVFDTSTKDRLMPYLKNPVFAAREEASKAFADFRKNPKIAG